MAGPVRGEWGGEEIILNDAATETTLLALIEAVNRLGGKKDSNNSGSNAADDIEELADAAESAESEVKNLGKSAKQASRSMSSMLGNAVSNVSHALAGLGEEFLIGGNRLSDFTSHITGLAAEIPLIGPILGGAAQVFVSVIDNQIDVFRNLSNAGVEFGSSLFDTKLAATKSGLSLDTFTNVISQNAESLALLGGSASAGARTFRDVSGIIQRDFGPQFAALGMTMDQTAQATADYLELQTRLGRSQRMSTDNLAAGAQTYILELDKLAKITGKQRDQIAKEMQQQALDKRIKAMFAGMDQAQRDALTGMLVTLENASPEIAEATREMMATGGVPVSDFGKSMQRLNPRLGEMAAGLMNGTVSQEQYLAEVRKTAAQMDQMSEAERRQIGILEATGNSALSANLAFIGLSNVGADLEGVMEAQTRQMQEGSTGLLAFENRLTQARNTIFGALIESGVFQTLENAFNSLVGWMTDADGGVAVFTDIIGRASLVFSKLVEDIQTVGLGPAFKNLWEETLKPTMMSAFTKLKEIIAPIMKDALTSVGGMLVDAISNFFKKNWDTILIGALAGIGLLLAAPIVGIFGAIVAGITAIIGWEYLKSNFTEIGTSITGFFTGIGDWFSDAIDSTTAWFSEIWNNVTGFFTGIGDWFMNTWNSTTAWFSEAWNNITGFVTSIGDWFMNTWNSVTSLFATARNRVTGFVTSIGDWFKNVWNSVTSLFATAWNNVTGFVTGIGDWFMDTWNSVTSLFATAWNNVTGFVTGIGDWFMDTWNSVTSLFATAWNNVTGFVTGIGDWFMDTWNSTTSLLSTAWNNAIGFVTGIGDWFMDTWNSVTSLFATAWNNAIGFVTSIGDWFGMARDFVFNAYAEAWSAVTGLIEKVVGFFGIDIDLPDLGEMVSQLTGSVQNFFKNIINKIPGAGFVSRLFGDDTEESNAISSSNSDRPTESSTAQIDQMSEAERRQIGILEAASNQMSEAQRRQIDILEAAGNSVLARREVNSPLPENVLALEKAALAAKRAFDAAPTAENEQVYFEAKAAADQAIHELPNISSGILQSLQSDVDDAIRTTLLGTNGMLMPDTAEISTNVSDNLTAASTNLQRFTEGLDTDNMSSYDADISSLMQSIDRLTKELSAQQPAVSAPATGADSSKLIAEKFDQLNTTMNNMLSLMQEGNDTSRRTYQTTRRNMDSVW
jgi:phage-related protein